MTSLDPPPASLRSVAAYVQRAKEMEKHDEVIMYWCLYHAAQTAMASRPTEDAARSYLIQLLDKLEALKAELAGNDAVTDDIASTAYVENFALKVFDSADNEDRAGKASRSTAMRFLAASSFIEVLASVSPSGLDSEMSARLKYAKWKASDISKALRAGVKPHPGPPGSEVNPDGTDAAGVDALQAPGLETVSEREADAAFKSALADEGDMPSVPANSSMPPSRPLPPPSASAPTAGFPSSVFPSAPQLPSASDPAPPSPFPSAPADFPSAPPAQPRSVQPSAPPRQPAPPARPTPLPASAVPIPQLYAAETTSSGLDPTRIAEIQKHAKWAISALNYEDVETARKELRLALEKLG